MLREAGMLGTLVVTQFQGRSQSGDRRVILTHFFPQGGLSTDEHPQMAGTEGLQEGHILPLLRDILKSRFFFCGCPSDWKAQLALDEQMLVTLDDLLDKSLH